MFLFLFVLLFIFLIIDIGIIVGDKYCAVIVGIYSRFIVIPNDIVDVGDAVLFVNVDVFTKIPCPSC